MGPHGEYKVNQIIVLTLNLPSVQGELRSFLGMSCSWVKQTMIYVLEEA